MILFHKVKFYKTTLTNNFFKVVIETLTCVSQENVENLVTAGLNVYALIISALRKQAVVLRGRFSYQRTISFNKHQYIIDLQN